MSQSVAKPDADDVAFRLIAPASDLLEFINSMDVLVHEAKIHVTDDGLTSRVVDPANVAMADVELAADTFESYDPHNGVIGVNLERFIDVLGMVDSDDLVEIYLDEETRKLHITCSGLEYTLALIDPDSIREEPDIPDLDLEAEVVADASDIQRGIKAGDMVSDHVAFAVDETDAVFRIEAEGDTDDVVFDLEREDLVDLDAGPAYSLFSLDYLKDIQKALDGDDEVTIELGEEFPMKLHTGRGSLELTFMVAPRIQSE